MSKVNHFAISSILNSEIVGRAQFAHGQIGSLGDAQRFLDLSSVAEAPMDVHRDEHADSSTVIRAFHLVRDSRNDHGSADLYVADPVRNAAFLTQCRKLGLRASDYTLNKTLMNARRTKRLVGLHSVKTSIDYEDFAFACEFAATELKYKTGASIDDLICDPILAATFDSIASRLAPGRTSFEYRWAILSIRKASGRRVEWKQSFRMPKFTHEFRLVSDPLDRMPDSGGTYLLFENKKKRPLYARSTLDLRKAVELHRRPEFLDAILDKFWTPDLDDFVVSYAEIAEKKLLKPVEKRLIEEQHPLFNIPRAA